MAIIYNNGANGTLKPPILNGIEQINSSTNLDFAIVGACNYDVNNFSINSATEISIIGTNVVNIATDTQIFQAVNMVFDAQLPISINQPIILSGFTSAEILAFSPAIEGSSVYCSTIQQMVFYQVSPITGTVLGWYNSTGTIKL